MSETPIPWGGKSDEPTPSERCAVCGNFSTHWAHTHGANVCDFHPFAPVAERCASTCEFPCDKSGPHQHHTSAGGAWQDPAPVADGAFAQIERDGHFAEELTKLLNRYSQENASNTPDFILCNYIVACLAAFNEASRAREIWYGKSLHI